MKKSILSLIFLLLTTGMFAQLPGSNDPTFNTSDDGLYGDNSGFNGDVMCMVEQTDGKLIVGGVFSSYNGTARAKIIRINVDGSVDNSFVIGTGFPTTGWTVNCMVLQPDGKVIVGGLFSQYNGITLHGLVRLNTDGSIDPTFNTNIGIAGATATVNALVLQTDGKVIAAGDFTTYNGTTRNRIVRINTDGSLDATFNPGTGFNLSVTSLALQPDGKVFAGGNFTTYNGNTRNRIVRIQTNGAIDMVFVPGTGFNTTVNCLALQPDGNLLVGGNFTTYNASSAIRIARIGTTGVLDASFVTGTGFNDYVYSLAIQTDGKIMAAGDFTTFNGTTSLGKVTRLNTNGSYDSSFDPGTGIYIASYYANVVKVLSNGKIMLGGTFSSFNNMNLNKLVRLLSTGDLDFTFNPGTACGLGNVTDLAIQNDNKILLVGTFYVYDGNLVSGIVRLNTDGSIDTSFDMGSGFVGYPSTIEIQADGKLLVSGSSITSYDGFPCTKLLRINSDGSFDPTFNPGTGPSTTVYDIAFQSDGKIILAGGFVSYNGNSCNRICRILADGTYDPTFVTGTGFDNSAYSLAIQPDDKIVVGGNYFVYNGNNRDKIARLNSNGSIDMTFNPGFGFNNFVQECVLQSDGKIIAGGGFATYNGSNVSYIARINTDGSLDNTYSIGTGFNSAVRALVIQPNDKVVALGLFTTFNSSSISTVARLEQNGTLDNSFNPGTGFNGTLSDAEIQSDGKIVVGGYFDHFNNIWRHKVARLNGGECNSSSVLNIAACDSYTLNSQIYTSSGTYYQTIPNALTCDSTITLNLTINPIDTTHLFASACSTYTLNAQTYSSSGNYNQNLTNIYGCDSVLILHLNINNNFSGLNLSVCDSVTINSQTFYSSGSYSQTLVNHLGCDSVLSINLTVNYTSSPTNLFEDVCDTYTLNTQTYTTSGSYTQNFTNTSGCDSIVHLDLIVRYSTDYVFNHMACNSYTFNSITYNNSGNYLQTLTNNAGCDSTIHLNLTIDGNATLNQTGSLLTASLGDTYQWINCTNGNSIVPGANNQTYTPTSSGSYAAIVTENSCIDTTNCSTFIPVGFEEYDWDQVLIYPNPTEEMVQINLPVSFTDVRIKVYNSLGEIIQVISTLSSKNIDLRIEGCSGFYFVSIESNQDARNFKIIKSK